LLAIDARAGAMRMTVRAALVLFAPLLGGAAQAQLGATLSVESDYRFRGVSLSDSKPAWRLTVNHDFVSGAYAGASATRVELARDDSYSQLVGYAGYVTRPLDGRSLEFGASFAHFTGDTSYDYLELYAGVLAERWALRVHYAPDYFGRGVQAAYVDANAHWPLNENVRVFGHAGALVPLAGRSFGPNDRRTRADLRFGLGVSASSLDVQLAWVGATRGGPYPAVYGGRRSTWQLSALYSF
jgi:uncharacterized protein (TIGR02001 family)